MFTDTNTISAGTALETDICIIGGGAAGITLALELSAAGKDILLIESGDFEFDAETQSLYAGTLSGVENFPLDTSRLRYFGGTTNHWGGQCSVLDALDLEQREWVAESGWPFGFDELSPYYAGAQRLCGLGPYNYDPGYWAKDPETVLDTDILGSTVFQFAKNLRFGQLYRSDLKRSKTARVILNANATKLVANTDGSTIGETEVSSLDGKRFRVRARRYVIAMGGIENARFLLNNRHIAPLAANDRIGRFFMDHPHAFAGSVVLSNKAFNQRIGKFYSNHNKVRYEDGDEGDNETGMEPTRIHGAITVNADIQRAERLANLSFFLLPSNSIPPGIEAVDNLWRSFNNRDFPDHLGGEVKRVITNLDDVVDPQYRHHLLGNQQPVYRLFAMSEQVPNRNSRVTLIDEKDSLGMNRCDLHWDLAAMDYHTLRRSVELVGQEFGRLGIGRVQTYLDGDPSTWKLSGGWHHMGTTRMHTSPEQGVVDANCRVHGMRNLYIAGSSVFPTCGHVNPTLTIVTLSMRLAEHLRHAAIQEMK